MTPPRIRRTDRFPDNERAARNKSRLMRARAHAAARVLLHLTSPQNTVLRFNSAARLKRATLTRASCEIGLFRFPRRGYINRTTYIVYRALLRDHRPFAILPGASESTFLSFTWHHSDVFSSYIRATWRSRIIIFAAAACVRVNEPRVAAGPPGSQ